MEKVRPKVACNIFVINKEKILLGKRKNCPGEGDWGLPGGHLEMNEHLSDCAKRELYEETGLKPEKIIFLSMINDPTIEDGTHYIHFNFLAENIDQEVRLMEPEKCYEWRWFGLDGLPDNISLGARSSIKAFLNKTTFIG